MASNRGWCLSSNAHVPLCTLRFEARHPLLSIQNFPPLSASGTCVKGDVPRTDGVDICGYFAKKSAFKCAPHGQWPRHLHKGRCAVNGSGADEGVTGGRGAMCRERFRGCVPFVSALRKTPRAACHGVYIMLWLNLISKLSALSNYPRRRSPYNYIRQRRARQSVCRAFCRA